MLAVNVKHYCILAFATFIMFVCQVLIVVVVVTSAVCIATPTRISAHLTIMHLPSQRSASTILSLLQRRWRRYEIGLSQPKSVTSLAINYFVDFYYSLCINLHWRVFLCCVCCYMLLILWTGLIGEDLIEFHVLCVACFFSFKKHYDWTVVK